MTNRGVFGGLTGGRWVDYSPVWRSQNFAGGGAVTTQPDIGNGSLTGRYIRHPAGLVVAQIALVGGSTTTWGSDASYYIWRLPVPGSRSNSGADLPIGNGYITQGTGGSTQYTQQTIPTLADPGAVNQGFCANSDEDYWVQGFGNRVLAAGTGSLASSATSTTITHNAGVTSGYVPAASDFIITATNSPSTNPRTVYVTNITSTQADIAVGVASTTTPLTFAWKVRGEPNSTGGVLLSPGNPWPGSDGMVIGFELLYEARR
jgi:hypothetical protein